VQAKYDHAIQSAIEMDERRAIINSETTQLRASAQQASDFLANAKSKKPQLEESKKAAIRAKNFRGAQQITQQLNQLMQNIDVNEKFVAESANKLDALEQEVSELSSEIASAQVEGDDAKAAIWRLDYDFFASAVDVLRDLFELSPYAKRLLDPLLEMFEFRLSHIEVPPVDVGKEDIELQMAELNDALQAAIEQDDFDNADSIQKKIDRLQAKLDKLSLN
jgi:chromosome segregation ATPase